MKVNWCFQIVVLKKTLGQRTLAEESLGQQGARTSQSWRKPTLNIHWKDWCWSWSFNTLATWCKEPTHWKRPWCWERLKAGGEGDDRGWDDWMASSTQWTWVWASSRREWRTGKPGVLQSMDSQRVKHDSATEQQRRFPFLKKHKLRGSVTSCPAIQELGNKIFSFKTKRNSPRWKHRITGKSEEHIKR